jgi:PadR family transcriptional regulator, regulatory protein PadR
MTRAGGALVGALDLLILRTLASRGPLHGYAIVAAIQQASTDTLRIEEGSLYPALHRMEKDRWLKATWRKTETNRRARVYTLTRAGARQLEAAEKEWTRIADGVARVLRTV